MNEKVKCVKMNSFHFYSLPFFLLYLTPSLTCLYNVQKLSAFEVPRIQNTVISGPVTMA